MRFRVYISMMVIALLAGLFLTATAADLKPVKSSRFHQLVRLER